MTDKQQRDLLAAFRQRRNRPKPTKEEAFQSLLKLGLITPDGELAPEYGGTVKSNVTK